VPPSLTGILGYQKLSVTGTATAHSAPPTYLDIYVLADNSPSMGLGATYADMDSIKALSLGEALPGVDGTTPCALACHVAGFPKDLYTKARDAGVTMRIDSVRNAINSLLDTAKSAVQPNVNIRFALYTFGYETFKQNLTNISPLSPDIDQAKTATAGIDLMAVTQLDNRLDFATPFNMAFNKLLGVIPYSGNGQNQASSKKLLFFVSDGVQDEDSKYFSCSTVPEGADFRCIAPIDVKLCDNLKKRGITIAAIYTTYLPQPGYYDVNVAFFNAGPYAPSPNSKIAQSMQACASPGYYQEVGPTDSIAATLSLLFNQFVRSGARITG
jgi:hypothetical protein